VAKTPVEGGQGTLGGIFGDRWKWLRWNGIAVIGGAAECRGLTNIAGDS